MAKGGHNAKSTARHIAEGTYNSTRHGKRLTIPGTDKYPDAPTGFDKDKAEKWYWLCERLHEAGLLTKADTDAMRLYVEAAILAEREQEKIEVEGTIIKNKGGTPIRNPRCISYEKSADQMRRLFDQFGLTPLARMRMRAPEPRNEEVDPLEELFN